MTKNTQFVSYNKKDQEKWVSPLHGWFDDSSANCCFS